jgi:sialidase-1
MIQRRKLTKQLWFFLLLVLFAEGGFMEAQSQTAEERDFALDVPVLHTSPLPKYALSNLDYGMTIGIEKTRGGKIWACWVAGGDDENGFFILSRSSDKGNSWSPPLLVIDPHDTTLSKKRRTLVGSLWLDPLNRLWLFFDQSMTYFDGRAGAWYTVCENPDSARPVWSTPKRIWHGCTLNKPIALKSGEWMLPISLWDRGKMHPSLSEKYLELDSLRKAHVFLSTDSGKTWNRAGAVAFPHPEFDEHQLIELSDGRIWMTARTAIGMYESFSADKGQSWSPPQPSSIQHINSRHFLRRLNSGRLLLVKHGLTVDQRTKRRSQLTAFLSDDEAKTWRGGLVLDERRGVSYPDGFQDSDGNIYISYDRNRDTDGHILMARFTEDDVFKKKFDSRKSFSKKLISQPGAIETNIRQ